MKTFSVAVAVAIVVLTFICIQESAATFTEIQELEKAVGNDNPAAEQQEIPVDSGMMPYTGQRRRRCRFCCDCCPRGGCGICCRF
ncbi:hepcidin-like [Solea solea]|uniref:hepcidin-like n=1 Tax=Solea solea TaxID=90069 RepID=UPI00272B4B49|nr:hepcidin-like [Solea solea]